MIKFPATLLATMSNKFVRILSIILTINFYVIYHVIQTIFFTLVPRQFRKKKNIKGQNVLITGAGSGVGRELAIEFSTHSVSLILVDINRESLLTTAKLLDYRSSVFIYDCDVSDSKMVYKMAQKIKDDVGDVDILVNNAGVVSGKYFTELPDEKIRRTIEVNTFAHFWTCKAFLPAMMNKNSGHIVSIASIVGKLAMPQMTDYCASKYAAIGFAESLEVELRERKIDGIKFTIVCPTHIGTGLFQGAKLSFIPTWTAKHVARQIISGVLQDEEIIFIPRWSGYASMLKDFFPRWMVIKVIEMTGDIKCMKGFTGRMEKTGRTP